MTKLPLDYIKDYFDSKDSQFYEGTELKHFSKYCERAEEVLGSFKEGAKKRIPQMRKLMKEKWESLSQLDKDIWVSSMIKGKSGVAPKFVSGRYHSKKSDVSVTFQSSYELIKLIEWENDPEVQSYGRCDFFLHYEHGGKLKRYFPDYFRKSNGKITMVEIKPKYELINGVVIAKLNSLKKYCRESGFDMEIVTEDNLKTSDFNISDEKIIFYKKDHKDRLQRTLKSLS